MIDGQSTYRIVKGNISYPAPRRDVMIDGTSLLEASLLCSSPDTGNACHKCY